MTITLSALQKQRRDTAANWTAENPTLLAGEIGIESDTGYWKVGDESTAWTSLAYVSGLGGKVGVPDGTAAAPAIYFADDTNTGIYSPGADQLALSTNGTQRISIGSDGDINIVSGGVLVGTSSSRTVYGGNASTRILVETSEDDYDTCLALVHNQNTGANAHLRAGVISLSRTRGTSNGSNTVVQSGDALGYIAFEGADGTNTERAAEIKAEVDGTPGANDMPGRLVFSTTADGASSPTERMRVNNIGGLYIGNSSDYSTSNYSQTTGNGNYYYRPDDGTTGGTIIAANNADRGWSLAYLNKFAWNSGDDGRWINFYLNGTSQDSINWTGSAINYGTSSDYRRKTNATTYTGGLEKVKQLHVREYDWIEFPDAGRSVGFFAHELQEIFPQAVTGVKDGMKTDEFTGEQVPDYQGIDYGKITPLLASALQEAITKIENLEAKVAALESA